MFFKKNIIYFKKNLKLKLAFFVKINDVVLLGKVHKDLELNSCDCAMVESFIFLRVRLGTETYEKRVREVERKRERENITINKQ